MRCTFGSFVALLLPGVLVAAEPPGRVLDLARWKLTLPVAGERADRAKEVGPPELAALVDERWFHTNDTGDGVVFRAPCGGVTTKGSKYPRCELRELDGDGELASWGTADGGVHTLTATLAITAVPPVKQHVVCAQIHDADDDLLMIRLEGQKLFVERHDAGDALLASRYQLGTKFDLKIEAAAGRVRVWHDGEQKLDWPVNRNGCYFKAGCYTQSNRTTGDAADAFGEVTIHRLQVSHQPPR